MNGVMESLKLMEENKDEEDYEHFCKYLIKCNLSTKQ